MKDAMINKSLDDVYAITYGLWSIITIQIFVGDIRFITAEII